jgi:hypothetical protein
VATIRQVIVDWTGGTGLPGQSVLWFDSIANMSTVTTDLHTLFNSIAGSVLPGISVKVRDSGKEINDANGALTGAWTGSVTASIGGSGSAYAAGTGLQLRWNTGLIVGRRRLVGRTFIAPIVSGAYDTDGTLLGAIVTALQGYLSTWLAASGSHQVVWHRPHLSVGGSSATVTTAAVPDKVTSLVTRRR